jgi:hypothetical protein
MTYLSSRSPRLSKRELTERVRDQEVISSGDITDASLAYLGDVNSLVSTNVSSSLMGLSPLECLPLKKKKKKGACLVLSTTFRPKPGAGGDS